jgi:hypothetical protein
VELPNRWRISVTDSTLGQRFATGREQPTDSMDVLGRGGSPEGWIDRDMDAGVAILRPDGN